MPPIYFHRNYNEEHYNTLIEQILSYKMFFLNMVTTVIYTFLPAMKKNLHAAVVSTGRPAELHHILRVQREEMDKEILLSSCSKRSSRKRALVQLSAPKEWQPQLAAQWDWGTES